MSGERGQLVTVVYCMSPSGLYVPPAIIFPRNKMNPELYRDASGGSLPLISDSGFISADLFYAWLKHFANFVKPSETDSVLLIVDNHTSYCSLQSVYHTAFSSTQGSHIDAAS